MAGPGARRDPRARPVPSPVLRLDRWLVVARFFRTRSLAAAAAAAGQVRVNGRHALRPGHAVAVGDTLTLVQGGRVRLIRIAGLAARRGPAAAAAALYVDLDAADDGAASGRLE